MRAFSLRNAVAIVPVGKFPARVMVSGVITFKGTASLVMYAPATKLTAEEYLGTLRHEHIPRCRKRFPSGDFTWIQVR
jgi:hypothetical protein